MAQSLLILVAPGALPTWWPYARSKVIHRHMRFWHIMLDEAFGVGSSKGGKGRWQRRVRGGLVDGHREIIP